MPVPVTDRTPTDAHSVSGFLRCPTPVAWRIRAASEISVLLLDHAALELKAAQQAQKLIRRYGAGGRFPTSTSRFALLSGMSRLAREELRHFERVVSVLEARGIAYRHVSPSRYAAALHAHIRAEEPHRLVDTLIVSALIEARSCERFQCLCKELEPADPALAAFYRSLSRSEARHFRDYLTLAETVAESSIAERKDFLLRREEELVLAPDPQVRFHSGVPGA